MAIGGLGGLLGGGLGQQYDPYQDLLRQQMMQGIRPITREEYDRATQSINHPTEPKPVPKTTDATLLLLIEEE